METALRSAGFWASERAQIRGYCYLLALRHAPLRHAKLLLIRNAPFQLHSACGNPRLRFIVTSRHEPEFALGRGSCSLSGTPKQGAAIALLCCGSRLQLRRSKRFRAAEAYQVVTSMREINRGQSKCQQLGSSRWYMKAQIPLSCPCLGM